jgi:hypothetical protein
MVKGFLSSKFKWKVIVLVNLILGAAWWFFDSTDFSLPESIPDEVFPALVGLAGLVSLVALRKASGKTRMVGRLLCLPSIIGGALYFLNARLLLMPPFTLGAMFNRSEIANETRIQEAISPDGLKVADVYFRPVGAYGGGNGRIFVRLKYRFFPVVEREVFYLRASMADPNTRNYLQWAGNDSLYISELKQQVPLPKVSLHVPGQIITPLGIAVYFIARDRHEQKERKLAIPVSDVPIYPGAITGDGSEYDEDLKTAHRFYNIDNHTPDEIADWYRHALSQPPWTVLNIDRNVIQDRDISQVRYCIQARRQEESGAAIYYWEVMGQERGANGVHVNIGTPNPITDACERYQKQP